MTIRFTLTHSTREMDFRQCDLNYLTNRYSGNGRLHNLPPLKELKDEYSTDYLGSFSIWDLSDLKKTPQLIFWKNKNFKVQQAKIQNNKLTLAGTAFLEIYNNFTDNNPKKIVEHNMLAGSHLFEILPDGRYVVSCSASDAILFFSSSGEFLDYMRVPEDLYGRNYEFPTSLSLRRHYINNDLQLTHLNSVCPYKNGFLVSTLIQGDIGFFDENKNYKQIISGFVGAHGVKSFPDGTIYFCDSCNGAIIKINNEGKIIKRYKTESKWLQDAVWIFDEIFLVAASDQNEMQLWDFSREKCLWRVACKKFGETTQFFG